MTRDLNDLMLKVGVDKRIPIYCDNIPKEVGRIGRLWLDINQNKKFSGSVNHGINVLKQYKHCSRIQPQRNGGNGQLRMDKKDGEFIEVPIDKFNHYIDGLRYYAVANAGLSCNTNVHKEYMGKD